MTRFTAAELDALFDAILVNDVVDTSVELPSAIRVDYREAQLRDGFDLSRQLWAEGFDRHALIALARALARDGQIDAAQQTGFKHVRARFKHLRFAFVLYTGDHRCPPVFKALTTVMGHLQDAFRAGRRAAIARYALLLRLMLTRPMLTLLQREVGRARITEAAGFRSFTLAQVAALRTLIAGDRITGHAFHAARKIVSRQVSFHDDMRTIHPAPDHHALSRYLSAINGLMGAYHDDLVLRAGSGMLDYARDGIDLPDDIRARLTAWVARYP